MSAQLTIAINGGTATTGGVVAELGDVARLRSATLDASTYRFEIYSFPPDADVTGWTYDSSAKVWYYLGATPPDVTLTPWGDWLFRLTLENGLLGGAQSATMTDETGGIRVLSAEGIRDCGEVYDGQFDTSWAEDLRNNWRRVALPTPVSESGADGTGTVKIFQLPPRRIRTTDNGTHDYLWDIGTTTLPTGCDANVLVELTAHLYSDGTPKTPRGAWTTMATWSRNTTGYLIVIGQSDIVDVDASGHTYRPGLTAGTYSTNDHTTKWELQAPTNATYHWIITTRITATYFAGA